MNQYLDKNIIVGLCFAIGAVITSLGSTRLNYVELIKLWHSWNGQMFFGNFGTILDMFLYFTLIIAVSGFYFNINSPNDFEYYHLPLVWPDSNNPLDLQTTGGNATMMINLSENDILLDGNSISNGDKIGIFYEGENKWLCAGFLIWNESMPPAALTMWGNIEDGFGYIACTCCGLGAFAAFGGSKKIDFDVFFGYPFS